MTLLTRTLLATTLLLPLLLTAILLAHTLALLDRLSSFSTTYDYIPPHYFTTTTSFLITLSKITLTLLDSVSSYPIRFIR